MMMNILFTMMSIVPMAVLVLKIDGVPTTYATIQLYLIASADSPNFTRLLDILLTLKCSASLSQKNYVRSTHMLRMGLDINIAGILVVGSSINLNEISNMFSPQFGGHHF